MGIPWSVDYREYSAENEKFRKAPFYVKEIRRCPLPTG
jgi:hypothetical protein